MKQPTNCVKPKYTPKQLQDENELLRNEIRHVQYENKALKELVNKADMELRGMMLVAKSMRPTTEIKKSALKILAAMIQSQPPEKANRTQVDAKKWARKAYEFAYALESEGGRA